MGSRFRGGAVVTLAFCTLALFGLAYAILALNQKIERTERRRCREQLLDRLHRTGQVTRW
jgi:hypothetical protein